jgi:hypothetical protein
MAFLSSGASVGRGRDGAARTNLRASLPGALDCDAMTTFGGQNVALCASPAVVDVVVIGVVTEAVLAKSTVVV